MTKADKDMVFEMYTIIGEQQKKAAYRDVINLVRRRANSIGDEDYRLMLFELVDAIAEMSTACCYQRHVDGACRCEL